MVIVVINEKHVLDVLIFYTWLYNYYNFSRYLYLLI